MTGISDAGRDDKPLPQATSIRSISLQEFDRRFQPKPASSPQWIKRFHKFRSQYQPGDELQIVVTSEETWNGLCGRAYVRILRQGKDVAGLLFMMN